MGQDLRRGNALGSSSESLKEDGLEVGWDEFGGEGVGESWSPAWRSIRSIRLPMASPMLPNCGFYTATLPGAAEAIAPHSQHSTADWVDSAA
jgi:hypothetical protein